MTDDPKESVKIEHRTVRVKPFSYQPSKAELEEPIILRKTDGSAPSVNEVVAAVFRPVKVVEDPDA